MKILITNDDSHRSPLLEIAVEYFSKLADVTLIVPLHEQSWTGKSMTRFDTIHAQKAELFGRPATFVSGTPADCVNLALYNLMPSKPDLVVSGINAGFNMGIGFMLSSGTVGACLEANLAGVPAIALSQAFDQSTRNRYISDFMIEQERIEIFRKHSISVFDRLTDVLFDSKHRSAVLSSPVTWNVNMPFNLTDSQVLRRAHLGRARYGQVFHRDGSLGDTEPVTFRHSEIEQVHDTSPRCDSGLLKSGVATVSVIDLWSLTGKSEASSVEPVLQAFTD